MPALCANGAEKLLENGETRLQMMVHCMGSSDLHSVQMEGFKLAQCFAVTIISRSFLNAVTILLPTYRTDMYQLHR